MVTPESPAPPLLPATMMISPTTSGPEVQLKRSAQGLSDPWLRFTLPLSPKAGRTLPVFASSAYRYSPRVEKRRGSEPSLQKATPRVLPPATPRRPLSVGS